MTSVKVTITHGRPDRILLDGRHLEHASFQYVRDDNGVPRVVIEQMAGVERWVRSFPVASAVFEGETGS